MDEASQNDIKLELDKLSQKLITEEILSVFPTHAVLGEEGYTGDRNSEYEWIVDPIDGTVNYFLHHSLVLRLHRPAPPRGNSAGRDLRSHDGRMLACGKGRHSVHE